MRRVVVTGMGLLTPLGCGVEFVWDRLLQGHSSAANITKFDTSDYATSYACEIPFGDEGVVNLMLMNGCHQRIDGRLTISYFMEFVQQIKP